MYLTFGRRRFGLLQLHVCRDTGSVFIGCSYNLKVIIHFLGKDKYPTGLEILKGKIKQMGRNKKYIAIMISAILKHNVGNENIMGTYIQ